MAEVLGNWKPEKRGREPEYPWREWTDGKARRALKGKDFKCKPRGFVSALYSHASRNGMTVKTSIDGNAVEFRFMKGQK